MSEGSQGVVETELGLALDSLLLSRPCHLRNGFRVVDGDGVATVVFSLAELRIGVMYRSENGTRLVRVSHAVVNLGDWNTITLDDLEESQPEVVLEEEELLFTPPRTVLRPCAYCVGGVNSSMHHSKLPGGAGASASSATAAASAAAAVKAVVPVAPPVEAPSTAEAMLERVTHHMLEQGVPLYVDGTDRGRVVFSLEELEPHVTYKSMDGLIKIRRLSAGLEFTDQVPSADASFVVTATGLPSDADDALETALGASLADGIVVVRTECGRAQLIKSLADLPDRCEFRSLCGHVIFYRVLGSNGDDDVVINGKSFPSQARANVTTATAPSFLDTSARSTRSTRRHTAAAAASARKTPHAHRVQQVRSAILNNAALEAARAKEEKELKKNKRKSIVDTPVWDHERKRRATEQMRGYLEGYTSILQAEGGAGMAPVIEDAGSSSPAPSNGYDAPAFERPLVNFHLPVPEGVSPALLKSAKKSRVTEPLFTKTDAGIPLVINGGAAGGSGGGSSIISSRPVTRSAAASATTTSSRMTVFQVPEEPQAKVAAAPSKEKEAKARKALQDVTNSPAKRQKSEKVTPATPLLKKGSSSASAKKSAKKASSAASTGVGFFGKIKSFFSGKA